MSLADEPPSSASPDDRRTTVAELREWMQAFVDERDWRPFHTPKNLAMSVAIEAAELMEHFQWLTPEASQSLASDPQRVAAVGEELADVLCYALSLANVLNLDVSQAMHHKLAKNRRKYPVSQIRGRYGHDDPNPAAETS